MERLSIDVVENATKTVNIMPETPLDKVVADCMTDYLEMRKAEEHKGGWIPFEDPTCDSGNIPDGEVLVCRADGTMDFDVYDFMYDDWRFNSKCHKNKVIAWRNLPEPYKAEEPQWKQAMLNTFLKR